MAGNEKEQYIIQADHQHYNNIMRIYDRNGWRQMTREEKEKYDAIAEKEMKRRKILNF